MIFNQLTVHQLTAAFSFLRCIWYFKFIVKMMHAVRIVVVVFYLKFHLFAGYVSYKKHIPRYTFVVLLVTLWISGSICALWYRLLVMNSETISINWDFQFKSKNDGKEIEIQEYHAGVSAWKLNNETYQLTNFDIDLFLLLSANFQLVLQTLQLKQIGDVS